MSALQRKPEWATTKVKKVNNRNNPVRRKLDTLRRVNAARMPWDCPVLDPVRRVTPADICPTSLEPVVKPLLGDRPNKTTTVVLDNWRVEPSRREGKHWVVVHSVPTKDREVVDRYYVSLDAALNRACALDEQRRTHTGEAL